MFCLKCLSSYEIFSLILTFITLLITIYIATIQLNKISKTSRGDFLFRFDKEIYTDYLNLILELVLNHLLSYEIKETESYYLIDISNNRLNKKDKIYKEVEKDYPELSKYKEGKILPEEIDNNILGYFENIGYFLKEGIINVRDTYHFFGWYIEQFWNDKAIKEYIIHQRKVDDKDLYENFEYVFNKCIKYKKHKY